MSTIIWKDGESMLVPPKRLQRNLDAGWSLTKEPEKKEKKATKANDRQLELNNESEQSH